MRLSEAILLANKEFAEKSVDGSKVFERAMEIIRVADEREITMARLTARREQLALCGGDLAAYDAVIADMEVQP